MYRRDQKIFVYALFAVISTAVFAQEKHPISMSAEGMKGRYVQQHVIDVDDVPGHQIRILEIQRTFTPDKQTAIEGERIVEQWGRGFSNYTGGIGPTCGYNTWITDKGNKIFIENSGTSETKVVAETGSKRGTYNGTSRFVGGTGKFAKIRGYLVEVTKFDTDPKVGYNESESHGEYWFEK